METSQVEKDAEITEAYHSFLNKCHVGSQYDWFWQDLQKKSKEELK